MLDFKLTNKNEKWMKFWQTPCCKIDAETATDISSCRIKLYDFFPIWMNAFFQVQIINNKVQILWEDHKKWPIVHLLFEARTTDNRNNQWRHKSKKSEKFIWYNNYSYFNDYKRPLIFASLNSKVTMAYFIFLLLLPCDKWRGQKNKIKVVLLFMKLWTRNNLDQLDRLTP